MHLVWGNFDGPVQSVVVVVLFGDDSHEPGDTNAIGAHGGDSSFAVFVEDLDVENFGVFSP